MLRPYTEIYSKISRPRLSLERRHILAQLKYTFNIFLEALEKLHPDMHFVRICAIEETSEKALITEIYG